MGAQWARRDDRGRALILKATFTEARAAARVLHSAAVEVKPRTAETAEPESAEETPNVPVTPPELRACAVPVESRRFDTVVFEGLQRS